LVQELVRYLLENLYLDFQGDISVDKVREFLREDDSKEARALLSKIIEENGVDDLLLALADCLKEQLRHGITEKTVRDQLSLYTES
jgi:predicted GTPase